MIIKSAGNLYTLKKRLAYLMAFAQYFTAKSGRIELVKPIFNAEHLDRAFIKAMKNINHSLSGPRSAF